MLLITYNMYMNIYVYGYTLILFVVCTVNDLFMCHLKIFLEVDANLVVQTYLKLFLCGVHVHVIRMHVHNVYHRRSSHLDRRLVTLTDPANKHQPLDGRWLFWTWAQKWGPYKRARKKTTDLRLSYRWVVFVPATLSSILASANFSAMPVTRHARTHNKDVSQEIIAPSDA